MSLRELWELCGNRCGNRKNPLISRAEHIYKREFPQFPHNIYVLLYHPYLGTKYRVTWGGKKVYICISKFVGTVGTFAPKSLWI
nr:MAG TPA: hypothetical protein [Caudoviricetes sp.]